MKRFVFTIVLAFAGLACAFSQNSFEGLGVQYQPTITPESGNSFGNQNTQGQKIRLTGYRIVNNDLKRVTMQIQPTSDTFGHEKIIVSSVLRGEQWIGVNVYANRLDSFFDSNLLDSFGWKVNIPGYGMVYFNY